MGLLDNLFKAVESGALEERLTSIADKVEKISDTVSEKAENLAAAPQKVLGQEQSEQDKQAS